MKKERRKFTSAFKAKVAVEAIKEDLTIQELAVKGVMDKIVPSF